MEALTHTARHVEEQQSDPVVERGGVCPDVHEYRAMEKKWGRQDQYALTLVALHLLALLLRNRDVHISIGTIQGQFEFEIFKRLSIKIS